MTVIGLILIAVGAFHLALLPFVEVRASVPVIAQALGDAEQRVRSADEALSVAAAAAENTAGFGRVLRATPELLQTAVADLVTRGRRRVGPRADPYKALISVPMEGTKPEGAQQLEDVLVEEAIRRQIGRHVEALSLSLESALEPLRSLKNPPVEAEELDRAGQALGRELVALNQVLQDAFATDPTFWMRWDGQGAGFGAASARAGEVTRRVEDGLRGLNTGLAAASAAWKGRRQMDQDTVASLRARQAELDERLQEFPRRLGWIPVDLEHTLRLYPIVAGALAVIALFRLRHILRMRRSPANDTQEAMPPSWGGGSLPAHGRWSVLLLVAVPLTATIHAAVAAITDPGLFVTTPGNPGRTVTLGFGAAYAAPILISLSLLLIVARAMMGARRARAAPAVKAGT